MATALTHAMVAVALAKAATSRPLPARFWLAGIACAILPDIDVMGYRWGIHEGGLLGPRGLTHSLFFAALLAALVVILLFRETKRFSWRGCVLWLYFAVVTASHGVLQAMSDGGQGVAFFAPFNDKRYFLPWRPLSVAPIGRDLFGQWGLAALVNELAWVWAPVVTVTALIAACRWTVRWLVAWRRGQALDPSGVNWG